MRTRSRDAARRRWHTHEMVVSVRVGSQSERVALRVSREGRKWPGERHPPRIRLPGASRQEPGSPSMFTRG